MENLNARFERFRDEFLKFERIEAPINSRSDLCAFLMLDKLVPGTRDMVCDARHDEIFFSVDPDKLNEAASDDQIRDLVRCGIRIDSEFCGLCMFV